MKSFACCKRFAFVGGDAGGGPPVALVIQPFHKHFVCIGGGPLILALVVVVHSPLFSSK